MSDVQIEIRDADRVREEYPPGRERRAALRRMGARVGLQDFDAEERHRNWRMPTPAEG